MGFFLLRMVILVRTVHEVLTRKKLNCEVRRLSLPRYQTLSLEYTSSKLAMSPVLKAQQKQKHGQRKTWGLVVFRITMKQSKYKGTTSS